MNAPDDSVFILEYRALRCNQAKHYMFVCAYFSQWPESSGTFVIIFEIKDIYIFPRKNPISHRVIGTAVEPCGVIVAAAYVRGYNQVFRMAFDSKIVYCKELIFNRIQVLTDSLIPLLCCFTNNCTPCTVIQLQLAAACSIVLTDKVPIYRSDVVNQFIHIRIIGAGSQIVKGNDKLLEELGRGRDGQFCDVFGIFVTL